MTQWTQKELEDLFIRKDLYHTNQEDIERRLLKIEGLLDWFQKLIISQGVILIIAMILFVVERFGPT